MVEVGFMEGNHMKRIISLGLVSAILCSLVFTGCSKKKENTVKFGNYDGEEIEWIVLNYKKTDSGEYNTLISKYVLDACAYSDENEPITWENSVVREMLNTEFYDQAFSATEKSQIVTTELENYENSDYGTPGGEKTMDNVYLLSLDEANQYFNSDSDRKAKASSAFKKNGDIGSRDTVYWLLRTPGHYSEDVAYVREDGMIWSGGDTIVAPVAISNTTMDFTFYGIRPVITVQLQTPVVVESKEIVHTPFTGEKRTDYSKFANEREKWDPREFGFYRGEDLVWDVIDRQDGKVLLLARNVMEPMPYNDKEGPTTWETCSLREWLNGEFYEKAFNASEKAKIVTTTVVNKDNEETGTPGGNDTEDKVFLLSSEEVFEKYDISEKLNPSPLLSMLSVGTFSTEGENRIIWWLRSPGTSANEASCLCGYSTGPSSANAYSNDKYGVRPAIWVDFDAAEVPPESIDISEREYLTETPIAADKDIYIKYPPYMTYSDGFTTLYLSKEKTDSASDPCVSYYMSNMVLMNLDFYMERGASGYDVGDGIVFYYSVNELETCASGAKLYRIDESYSYSEAVKTFYLVVFPYGNETIEAEIRGFGTEMSSEYYAKELEAVLNFFRTCKDPFLIVERGTQVNVTI